MLTSQNKKIILGLKLKQIRKASKLSFSDLSKRSGLSVSYLNEIEKGKKYPKSDKLHSLAIALNIPFDELTSAELNKNLSPINELLNSNFLNELPLDLFGIDASKLIEIIANAPTKVSAFISAILDIARKYELQEENFYFAALRSYQELHNNYFEDLEKNVDRFIKKYKIDTTLILKYNTLDKLLREEFDYKVTIGFPEDENLQHLRYIFIKENNHLLLNEKLNESQRTFILGREVAYNYLDLQERFYSTSTLKVKSFEQVLNNFQVSYFSVALMMPIKRFNKDIKSFFENRKWDENAFKNIMDRYASTPEMFIHRLTHVLPKFFDIPQLFFLKFTNYAGKDRFDLDKEIHLSQKHHPHENDINEHYCRKWVSLWLLHGLYANKHQKSSAEPLIGIQKSKYIGTNDEYLCITIALSDYFTPNKNVSITLGILINDDLKSKIKFLDDDAIQTHEVGQTCERCSLENCADRAAENKIDKLSRKRIATQNAINKLIQS